MPCTTCQYHTFMSAISFLYFFQVKHICPCWILISFACDKHLMHCNVYMATKPVPSQFISEALGRNFPVHLITNTGLSSRICTFVTSNAAQKPLPNRSHSAKPQTHHSLGKHDPCCLQSWQAGIK